MKVSQMILSALTGWMTGIASLLGWSVLWPKVLPVANRAGALPGYWKLLLFAVIVITPFALAGGVIGGRLPYEGGRRQQILYAAVGGATAALVFGSCVFWYIGW